MIVERALCVGHGPSCNDHDFIRNFDGIIVCVDATTHELIEDGIIPDYMVYCETGHTIIRELEYFMPDYFGTGDIKTKMKIVYNKDKMTYVFKDRLRDLGIRNEWWNGKYGNGRNNAVQSVGLYALGFCDYKLGVKEVHLIGFDYRGLDYMGNDMTVSWKERTIHYLKGRRNALITSKIIDHSGGDFPSLPS